MTTEKVQVWKNVLMMCMISKDGAQDWLDSGDFRQTDDHAIEYIEKRT